MKAASEQGRSAKEKLPNRHHFSIEGFMMVESSGEPRTELPVSLTKLEAERNDLVQRKNSEVMLPENALPRWIQILMELIEQAQERAASKTSQ